MREEKGNKTLDLLQVIKILKEHRKELEDKFGIVSIKIFGSYVKNKQTHKSDLDLIVEFKNPPGFIKLMSIEEEISNLLGIKVDLLTEEGISPYLREHILKEAIAL